MTGPAGDAVGVVYADVRFRGDKAPKDVADVLDDVGDQGDAEMEDIGDKWGDTLDEHLRSSTRNTGRDVARGISAGIEREGLRITSETLRLDSEGNIVSRWVRSVADDAVKAIKKEESSGVFRKIGSAFTDAVGAGFNISGKSPLITLLIPVLGEIAALVAGAIQAVGALSALLFIIPNLVFSVGLEIGVLLLAFQGLGEAIQGAFAATNADELKKALEGLTPAAQGFVRQLLPMRDLFNQLQDIAQQGFFSELGDILTRVFNAKSPFFTALSASIGPLSESLGGLAAQLVGFLNDPVFIRFLNTIVPQTTAWLDTFGPALTTFLVGLSNIGTAVGPLFEWFGGVVNSTLANFGQWLSDLSTDQDFLAWLEEVKSDLAGVGEFFKQAGIFLFEFVKQLDAAGGDKIITDLTAQLKLFTEYLSSPAGQKAMEGLVHIIQLAIVSFTLLGFGVLFFFTAIEVVAEYLRHDLIPDIKEFSAWVGGGISSALTSAGSAIANFFTVTIPGLFSDLRAWVNSWTGNFFNEMGARFWHLVGIVVDAFAWFGNKLLEIDDNVRQWLHDRIQDVRDFVNRIRGAVGEAALQFIGMLYGAGQNIIDSLIAGIKSKFSSIGDAVRQAASIARGFFPFSPAKEGPLSGSGDPMIAGQKIIQRLATGIDMEAPSLTGAMSNATSNVLMGAGAVQMNFYGQTPSQQEAASVGSAAGNSFASVLAARNTRLAIRTA